MFSFLLPLVLLSQLSDPVIFGPTSIEAPGSALFTVRKDLVGSEAQWIVTSDIVLPPGAYMELAAKDGSSVLAVNRLPEARYTLIFVSWDRKTVDAKTLVVGKGSLPPPPSPVDPDFDKLKTLARDVAQKIPPGPRAKALALSTNFLDIANGIRSGTLASDDSVMAEIVRRNNATLSAAADASAWEPWRIVIGEEIDRLDTAGKWATSPFRLAGVSAIASGLAEVK